MNEHQIVDSSFTAIVAAPLATIDIPTWCFNLPEQDYQACSPAHIAAGFTTAPDGRRMSINVEVIRLATSFAKSFCLQSQGSRFGPKYRRLT